MLAKKPKKRKTASKKPKEKLPAIFGTIFILFAFYLLYTNVMIYFERSKIGSNYSTLDKSYSDLSKEKEVLQMQLGETFTDQYLEKVAREELGLYKEGEQVIVIKKEEPKNSSEATTSAESKNILEQAVQWIGGLFSGGGKGK